MSPTESPPPTSLPTPPPTPWLRVRHWIKGSPPPRLDDRQQPLPPLDTINPAETVQRLVSEVNPRVAMRRKILGVAFMALAFGYLVWAFVLRPTPTPVGPHSFIGLAYPITFMIGYSLYRRWLRRAGAFQPPLDTNSATLLAAGYCGCCGYPLVALPPDPDKCIRCPECNAAWNATRFTLAHDPQRASARLTDLHKATQHRGLSTDDRGVRLNIDCTWPHKQGAKKIPSRFREAVSHSLDDARNDQRGNALILLAVAWVGLAVVLVLAIGPEPGVGIALITLVPAIGAGYLVIRGGLPSRKVRLGYLSHRCCPACHSLLAEETPAFDACIPCKLCEHAWRADALGTPPPPAQAESCPSCGYNTTNLPICPECGTTMPIV